MHALVRFSHLAAGGTFTTAELYPHVLKALGASEKEYKLSSLRYDLRKLRVKGLVANVERTRRYRLTDKGYSICLLYLKLFERIYAPLTAGVLQPYHPDDQILPSKRTTLDRLYQRLTDDLDQLFHTVGIKLAA